MKRAIIIGCPGGGKSTFARSLHEKTGLPLIYLDMLNWNTDRTTVPREVFRERLADALSGDEWIIDGNYCSTMEQRIAASDTVFFLDYPPEVCMAGILSRRGTVRPDIPWVESPDDVDEEFVSFVKNFETETRPIVLELLRKYGDRTIITFRNRQEASEYLSTL